jgi:dipeptidyl aminopeptidase/acylaminoacyl peptidase
MRTVHLLIVFAQVVASCSGSKNEIQNYSMQETVLTTGTYGHTLNAAQVFSPDDLWILYDTRNEDSHIQSTGSIEKVHAKTGEVITVYSVEKQTAFGPGVGAVACHPHEHKVIFIHGLLNCDEQRPYGFTRRFGAITDFNRPSLIHAEGRCTTTTLVAGALRGGTHAHTWSGDGKRISFTYNDYLMEALEKSGGLVKDLRTIGVMTSGPTVAVSKEDEENFSGQYFAVVAATVTEKPTPGSDEVERAFDECWIGTDGYTLVNGRKQKYAIAFQGMVRTADGRQVTEVFVADIPTDITQAATDKPLEGTASTRPNVPAGLVQRRITFTADRKHAGIQGPRYRLRTSPDGSVIYFLMKDDGGVVQVFSVSTTGGSIRQVTNLKHSVQTQFNVSPDGNTLSVVADNSIWFVDASDGQSARVTERTEDERRPVSGALWSHDGKTLVFNRYVPAGDNRYLQIVKMSGK